MTISPRSALLLAVAFTVACSDERRESDPPRQAAVLAGAAGITSFAQTVERGAGTTSIPEVFPGQANTWTLDRNFSLATGYGGQYVYALELYLGAVPANPRHGDVLNALGAASLEPLPYTQAADELTFLSPRFTVADGLRTVAVSNGESMGVSAITGKSAFLNGTSDSRLSRTLELPGDGPYTLGWSDGALLEPGNMIDADAGAFAPSYRVVLRDPATGELLEPIFSTTTDVAAGARAYNLPGTLPPRVELSFELRSAAGGYAVVDDVVLLEDGAPVVAFTNGGFEEGLNGWTGNGGSESQNVRSGARDVAAAGSTLRVTRTFYAAPAAPWARLVDVFENTSDAQVSMSAVYLTQLGGVSPLAKVRTGGRAVVGWDALGEVRDVGLVLGTGTALVDEAGLDSMVFLVHPLTVPAHGRVALAHFVVQLGAAEGGPTSAEEDVPAGTDAVCEAIARGFRSTHEYANDLEPGVLEAIANF